MNISTYLQQTKTTQQDFASQLGISQGLVSQWLLSRTTVTADRAVQIEKITNGKVTRLELRPDLFSVPAND